MEKPENFAILNYVFNLKGFIMSQLVSIRQKIRTIHSTKKITHAVRLVSMSLYNKLDKLNKPLSNYSTAIKNEFNDLSSKAPGWTSPLFSLVSNSDNKNLWVIVGSSKGLCGSLNANLFRFVESSMAEEKQEPDIIVIGQRVINFTKKKNIGNVIRSYPDLNSNNFIAIADDLIDKISTNPKSYNSVVFFNNQARNIFTQKPDKSILLPLSQTTKLVVDEPTKKESDIIWEQTPVEILDYVSIRYLRSSVIHYLYQALRAEHAARFLAMENATNNASKYLDKLFLQYNKLRQELITREVSELCSSLPSR